MKPWSWCFITCPKQVILRGRKAICCWSCHQIKIQEMLVLWWGFTMYMFRHIKSYISACIYCVYINILWYTMLYTAYIFWVYFQAGLAQSSDQVRLRSAESLRSPDPHRAGGKAGCPPWSTEPRSCQLDRYFTVRYWKWPSRKFKSFPIKEWWVSIVMLNYQRAAFVHNCGCLQEKQDHFSGKMVRFCPILLELQEWHIASANLLMSPPTPTGIIMNLE